MNVIMVMSDSFRRDHIGALGNKWIRTPALDRFAGQATDFPRFRMGSYATIPQRTDLFTGKFSYADRPWAPLKATDVVLAELLQAGGVETYLSGDTPHIFKMGLTFMRGFTGYHWSRGSEGDIWWTDQYAEDGYQPPTGKGRVRRAGDLYRRIWVQGQRRVKELDWTTPQTFQAAIEWLTRNWRRQSFFLYIDTFDPHEPWDPPDWARDLYDPSFTGRPYAWAEYGAASQYGRRELRHLQALYAGECTVVDRWFGRLVDTVDLLGLGDRTMIIFLSDHGHYLGYPNDGKQVGKFPGYRRSDGKAVFDGADVFMPLLDSVSNPPLLVRLPGQKRARRCGELVQPVDLFPTVLEAFGVKGPADVHGQSLMPLLEGRRQPLRREAVTAAHGSFAQNCDRRWLYGVWNQALPPRLFDRVADPDQRHDLIRQEREVGRRLHRRLLSQMRAIGSPDDWLAQLDASAGLVK